MYVNPKFCRVMCCLFIVWGMYMAMNASMLVQARMAYGAVPENSLDRFTLDHENQFRNHLGPTRHSPTTCLDIYAWAYYDDEDNTVHFFQGEADEQTPWQVWTKDMALTELLIRNYQFPASEFYVKMKKLCKYDDDQEGCLLRTTLCRDGSVEMNISQQWYDDN